MILSRLKKQYIPHRFSNSINYLFNNNNRIITPKREFFKLIKNIKDNLTLIDGETTSITKQTGDEILNSVKQKCTGIDNSGDSIFIKDYVSYFRDMQAPVIPKAPEPPVAIEFTNRMGMVDNYNWLRDIDNRRVLKYIDSENRYLREFMDQKALKPLSKSIRKVFQKSYIDSTDEEYEVIDGYEYFKEGGSYFRKRISDQFVQLLFMEDDEMEFRELSDGDQINNPILQSYFNLKLMDLTSIKFSEDQQLFAYVADAGNEEYIAVVKRVKPNSFKSELIEIIDNVLSIEWGKHNELYYTTRDHIKRPDKIYRKVINETLHSSLNSELIYHEPSESNLVEIVKSKDSNYLLFCSNNKLSTLIYYINLNIPYEKPKIILNRKEGLEYYVEHNDDKFIIFANFDKKDLSIYSVPDSIENGDIGDLKPLILSINNLCIRDVDLYKDKLVLHELLNSIHRLRIISKDPETKEFSSNEKDCRIISFEDVCKLQLGVNNSDKNSTFRVYKQSPIQPMISYDFSLTDTSYQAKGDLPTMYGPLAFIESDFVTKRDFVQSSHHPSIKIPISVIHHKDVKLNGKNPCLIKGYGAYGTLLEADFDLEDRYLLNSGWIIVLAHVRGGGEMGRQWYDAGRGKQKLNTFYDFIDCVEYLFREKYTEPKFLIGKGGSAGGLLMAYVALQYPHYFSGIIAKVPFVDVLNTMLDESLPLTIHEQGEWGNPITDNSTLELIKTYDPYLLIDKLDSVKSLPNLYLTCSTSDFRVPFWQPLRFTAKLRQHLKSSNRMKNSKDSKPLILLHIQNDTGHFGPRESMQYYQTLSDEFTFMISSVHLSSQNSNVD
ncbi:oligopeptidase B [Tieghemostelium lacteum]|uniref:Prolyl endopeptidase n=1 Tax=Tieghemostelium lacteum TaxID=361077 RepID=A0A151ZHP7_TIELA|nr:oligopeptidase B [Tieghemostelium lacteum]|eukprot:KYQ93521.1 oligopeptidase B [Tieghemostelium lacteum]